jgi:hypothetical protein
MHSEREYPITIPPQKYIIRPKEKQKIRKENKKT